ncbi:hypothetical protein FAZ19_06975 [Sphingobacterium alkalisoli]|uniref:Uncharacterized protein n=1 Tax=Sphingobacterium alkalisoli TaxID=1874115 RepID=A0A4U0H745_9SPHI|nr:hypothetical protein FAZ19_06975 [Sphingobacterium alkalisoli]
MVLQLKRLGKKKIIAAPYQLPFVPTTLQALIEGCVAVEVARYNQIRGEAELLSFLNPQQIQEQSEKGKISFGDIANVQPADPDVAIATALLAHRDGLFVVFVDGIEVKDLKEQIYLYDGVEVTFIRLTFLAGRMV